MGAIEDVYADLDTDVSLEEFREAVSAKVEQMGGLADEETAAMLLAHELAEHTVSSIADIKPAMEEAKFIAKVSSVGELRTFNRDDGEPGQVINVEAVDETGSVRLAFWDEQAGAIESEGLDPGTVLRVKGRPSEGYNGLEVSVQQAEPDPDADIDVDIGGIQSIDDLTVGQEGVTVRGRVLDTDDIRTFDRDDGSEGRVSNLQLGDETGRIRVTLWDDRTDAVEALAPGDAVEIYDASVRERDGAIECHVGDRGAVETIDEPVSFVPHTVPIADLTEGTTVDVAGVIRSTDEKRTFERDDGTTGQVRNVRLQDESGDIRVALWGDDADRELAPGDTVWFGNVEVRDGWQDPLEVSVSWDSIVAAMDLSDVEHVEASTPDPPVQSADGSTTLGSFESSPDQPDSESGPVTFAGTVVQTGDPVIVDDGDEALRVDTDVSLTLGQDVVVNGVREGERIDAESVTPST